MRKIAKITSIITLLATMASLALPVAAADLAVSLKIAAANVGPWAVSAVAQEADGWIIESHKVDRDLLAWTERNDARQERRLQVFDGVQVRTLATLPVAEWNQNDQYFVEPVSGDYDAADGLVVWTQSDGQDREIWSYDGDKIARVSDNSYDDRHPVTSRGRVAWTSQPGTVYNLMVKDSRGRTRLDSWQVMNYAFSGDNLYWIAKRGDNNWFSVLADNSRDTVAVLGIADDRPMRKYFFTDGLGSAAWEFSTKRWDYDRRSTYVSVKGAAAVTAIERYVPPMVTRLEDAAGPEILMSVTDLQYQKFTVNVSLIRTDGSEAHTSYLLRSGLPHKSLFLGNRVLRQVAPDAHSPLVLTDRGQGGLDYVSLDAVLLNQFEADGETAAGALVAGGLVTRLDGKTYQIPAVLQARSLAVHDGAIAWLEGQAGHSALKVAFRTVLVRAASGTSYASGYLAKAPGIPSVYLMTNDGQRYVIATEGQLFGWYRDFSSVRTISKSLLAAAPLAGKVLYRPGQKLVKGASSPRVYAVGEKGSLHWIKDESVATQFYGANWNRRVVVMPDHEFAEYAIGAPVDSLGQYGLAMAQ